MILAEFIDIVEFVIKDIKEKKEKNNIELMQNLVNITIFFSKDYKIYKTNNHKGYGGRQLYELNWQIQRITETFSASMKSTFYSKMGGNEKCTRIIYIFTCLGFLRRHLSYMVHCLGSGWCKVTKGKWINTTLITLL